MSTSFVLLRVLVRFVMLGFVSVPIVFVLVDDRVIVVLFVSRRFIFLIYIFTDFISNFYMKKKSNSRL
jgi:hypothetical protein